MLSFWIQDDLIDSVQYYVTQTRDYVREGAETLAAITSKGYKQVRDKKCLCMAHVHEHWFSYVAIMFASWFDTNNSFGDDFCMQDAVYRACLFHR